MIEQVLSVLGASGLASAGLFGVRYYATKVPKEVPAEFSESSVPRGSPEFHVARFEAAIEQCVKGPERIAELQRWLAYWQARKTADDALAGDQ